LAFSFRFRSANWLNERLIEKVRKGSRETKHEKYINKNVFEYALDSYDKCTKHLKYV